MHFGKGFQKACELCFIFDSSKENQFIFKISFMKIVKFLLKFLVLPFVVLVLGSLVFFNINNRIYLAGEDAAHIAYLNQHKEVLDKNNTTFNSFDSVFYSNNVIILSENHGFEDVQSVDYQLFIHLNQKMGVRFYIGEMDSLVAKKLNTFLKNPTPDIALLKSFVNDIGLNIPQQSSQQLLDKWMRIHTYNAQLKDDAKIEILGLDKNMGDTSKISRDSSMLLNFKNIVEKRGLQQEKFYGLFGYFHSMQSGISERNTYPFAAKLKRNTTFPQFQKVQTIACLTLESEMYFPPFDGMPTPPDKKTSLCNLDGPILLCKGIKDVKAASALNTMTLFHLNEKDSPYKKSQRLAGIKVNILGDEVLPKNDQQTTTDFFQHIILMRGSKSLSPLNQQ
jgi:hypothetical protein